MHTTITTAIITAITTIIITTTTTTTITTTLPKKNKITQIHSKSLKTIENDSTRPKMIQNTFKMLWICLSLSLKQRFSLVKISESRPLW